MEPLEREIEEVEEERFVERSKWLLILNMMQRSLKSDEEKHKADLASAQAEVEKLGTQVEAAKTMKEEHEQRKNAALQEIESISRRLLDQ